MFLKPKVPSESAKPRKSKKKACGNFLQAFFCVPLARISIYLLSPHPPPTRRRSPFSTKLGKAERAKVGVWEITYNKYIKNPPLLQRQALRSGGNFFAVKIGLLAARPTSRKCPLDKALPRRLVFRIPGAKYRFPSR